MEHGEFIASIGLSCEFPTGSSDNGIGNGHFELSPFLALSSQPANAWRWASTRRSQESPASHGERGSARRGSSETAWNPATTYRRAKELQVEV